MTTLEALGSQGTAELLRSDVTSGRVAHAYLFSGAAGSIPKRTALAFASALLCPRAGCGTCEICVRVAHHAHPDVELIEPAGTQLLVDQVREVVKDAWQAPVAGARRVIVVEGADRMNPNAQNAFLKALEEPPASTVIVLIAPSVETLLPTVRSRCREIAFRTPRPAEVAEALVGEGVEPSEAELWARTTGALDRALELATTPEAREEREALVERVLEPIRDPGEALEAADELAKRTKAIRDRVAAEHKAVASEHADWYQETKRTADDRLRREQRRAEQDALEGALDDIASVLRDLLVSTDDRDADLLNHAHRHRIRAVAGELIGARKGLLACLDEIERARRRLRANANVLLTIEQVFLRLGAELGPKHRRGSGG